MSFSHYSKLNPTKREDETLPYMEFLDPKDASFVVDDALLDFTLEGEEDQLNPKTSSVSYSSSSTLESSNPAAAAAAAPFSDETRSGSFPEVVEEELEWLSNKEAFPAVETCFGILSDNPDLIISNHKSPISVLENSTSSTNSNNDNSKGSNAILNCFTPLKVPINFRVGARSKRRRRTSTAGPGESPGQHCPWPSRVDITKKNKRESTNIGRRCLHCQADKTPQWRAGPMGPKTLCNACGVRYKSGRLLPEYRPANSPTFSSSLHSNSHRKVVEMRKQKLGTQG